MLDAQRASVTQIYAALQAAEKVGFRRPVPKRRLISRRDAACRVSGDGASPVSTPNAVEYRLDGQATEKTCTTAAMRGALRWYMHFDAVEAQASVEAQSRSEELNGRSEMEKLD